MLDKLTLDKIPCCDELISQFLTTHVINAHTHIPQELELCSLRFLASTTTMRLVERSSHTGDYSLSICAAEYFDIRLHLPGQCWGALYFSSFQNIIAIHFPREADKTIITVNARQNWKLKLQRVTYVWHLCILKGRRFDSGFPPFRTIASHRKIQGPDLIPTELPNSERV